MKKQIIKISIFYKVFVIFACLVLGVIIVFGAWIVPLQKQSLQQIMYTQGETIAHSIFQACASAMIAKDYGFIIEHNLGVLEQNSVIRYVLISGKEQTIWIYARGWKILPGIPEEYAQLQKPNITFKIIKNAQLANSYHFVYPIVFEGLHWGWLHIGFSLAQYNQSFKDLYQQIFYISCISIFLTIFLGYFFARWLTRPIAMFSDLATKVAQGDFDVSSTIDRSDEIGILSENFNLMIKSLRQSKALLQNYNQELEQEVKRRTEELDLLNQSLDQRIQDEVAQRQEQERMLIHQSRLAAMGEMIGAIAHQWRQPLNALSLVHQNTYFLYKNNSLDDELMQRNADKSERLIAKMSSTINDFRNFFKPNKQKGEFLVKRNIQAMIDLLDAAFKKNDIEVQLEGVDVSIIGFEGEFSQVILNIVDNAKDALVSRQIKNPKIAIKVEQNSSNTIIIRISDNAGGISNSIIDKIYDPYFTTKEEGKGTGIGLYMSKIIIEKNMGGKVYAYNSGVGAVFIVELPIGKNL